MLAPAPVYPDEAHADGDGDDGAEDAEEEEEEDPLGGLHLEEQHELVVEGRHVRSLLSHPHHFVLLFLF